MPVRIQVQGLGDIAPIAVWAGTSLETAAQGQSSPGTIVARDFGLDPRPFVQGSRVTVDLGVGRPTLWSGYLQKASRRFFFPVDDPSRLHRQWVLSLADINCLFTARWVFDKASPAHVAGPTYKTDTNDSVAIADLCSNWLDLSTDDLDVESGIETVASIYYGQPVQPWNAGMQWKNAMDSISQLPAAVYYIDPDRKLIYTDAGSEDAPFELSDHPDSSQRGYRLFTEWEDGTQLGNDALCWGFGKGVNYGVFRRLQDADSIALHDLWQVPSVSYAIWHQSTIDKVADSIVNGSPSSRRGQKNDIHSIDLTTEADGLRVGQKVRVLHEDLDIVLPIRKATMKFDSPESVQYQLHLTDALDRWGFEDPMPPFKLNYPLFGLYAGRPSCVIDSFNGRTVGGAWGGATNEDGTYNSRLWQADEGGPET
jgi:hypothetical protein